MILGVFSKVGGFVQVLLWTWMATVGVALAPPEVVTASSPDTQRPVARPTGPVTTCVTSACHTDILSGRFLHGPTAQRQCDSCHVDDDVSRHTYRLTVPQVELCTYCHTKSEREIVHKPVTDQECEKCHDPHGSDYPKQLVADPSRALCYPCHKLEQHGGARPTKDQPEMRGACNVCHEPHSSWMPRLLRKDQQELCLYCHESMWARLELIGRTHAPVLDGPCLQCHDAHATAHPRHLREDAPALCFSCHDHDSVKTLIATAPVVHGALDEPDGCIGCHVGHGSAAPGLIGTREIDLCLSCHNEPRQTEEGRTIANIAYHLKANARHHGPIRDGQCSPCHASHAAAHASLLDQAYPELFYASFDVDSYALCFECHIEELVTQENGVGVTGFRDGERNLHFVHVNKQQRGRTCRSCHDVHATSRPFHIRDSVPFWAKWLGDRHRVCRRPARRNMFTGVPRHTAIRSRRV